MGWGAKQQNISIQIVCLQCIEYINLATICMNCIIAIKRHLVNGNTVFRYIPHRLIICLQHDIVIKIKISQNKLISLYLKTRRCKCYAINIMYIKLGCIHSLDWIIGLESFWIRHINGVMQIISLVHINHAITYERVLAYLR